MLSTIQRKVQAGFAISLVCLALIGVVSWLALDRLRDDDASVDRSYLVMTHLESVTVAAAEAQAAVRGYVITGEESYLEPYRREEGALTAQLQELRTLTAGNALQQHRLDTLAARVAQQLAAGRMIVNLRRTQQTEAATREVLAGSGQRLHAGIRSLVDEMQQTEQSLLADREVRARQGTAIARGVIIGGGLLALLFASTALVLIRRQLAGRRETERAIRETRDGLELRVRERTAQLAEANASLVESARLLRETGQLARVGGWEFDPVSGKGHWTEEVARIHDLERDTDTSVQMGLEFYPGESRTRIAAAVKEAVEHGTPYDLELEFISARGVHKWVRSICRPLVENGKVVRVRGTFQDITERKQVEAKLESQLERLALLSQITRAIGEHQDTQDIFQIAVGKVEAELPLDLCFICLHDAARRQLTVAKVASIGATLATRLSLAEHALIEVDDNGLSRCLRGELVYEQDVSQMASPFPARLADGGLRSMVVAPLLAESAVFGVLVAARRESDGFTSSECEFLRQLSEHVALAAHQAQLHDSLQRAYDDLHQTQQAIMQQERLRALGQMASGIAHDINNAISPIAIYTDILLRKEPDLSARTREFLETIQRAIGDVAQTVSRMREFYRPGDSEVKHRTVDLNAVVQQVLDLTRARWRDMSQQRGIAIEIKTELAPDLPAVMGAESELREALTNLVLNAVDAMPDGGTLTLRTRVVDDHASLPAKMRGPARVCVEICDTGIGMDEETRRRCLEPFFTTKGERGTGLGLAMVYGVAQRHAAELQIASAAGRGTTMSLAFPVAAAAVAGDSLTVAPAATPAKLRILIVDDDPVLLKSLRDTLEADGHLLSVCRGGQAGIDDFCAAHRAGRSFDAVITDLGMPRVDGRKVANAIKALAPTVPIILLTGWGQRIVTEGEIPPDVDRVLSKPPNPLELSNTLAELTSRSDERPTL
jgi:signal transduction histidine kinase/PAS domain-containing protein/ActR/RegA family two-component response regulator